MSLPVIAVPAVVRAVPRTGAASVTVGPLPAIAAARANAPVPMVTVVAAPAIARAGVVTPTVPETGLVGLPSYVSAIAQTLRVVEHPDGVHQVYAFTAGGTYTPVSQEEAWIFADLAAAYGLTLALPIDVGYGLGVYGEGVYGA